MIHRCNLNCHTMDPSKLDALGLIDEGQWLPFLFNLDMVEAAKMSTADTSSNVFNCTTIFAKNGDTFIIDTPFDKFASIYESYDNEIIIEFDDKEEEENETTL